MRQAERCGSSIRGLPRARTWTRFRTESELLLLPLGSRGSDMQNDRSPQGEVGVFENPDFNEIFRYLETASVDGTKHVAGEYRARVEWLDGWLDDEGRQSHTLSGDSVYAYFLRAALRSRLLTLLGDSDGVSAEADLAYEDSTRGLELATRLALIGRGEARRLVALCLHRLLVIAERHPQLGLARVSEVTQLLEESRRYIPADDPYLIPTVARLASTHARQVVGRGESPPDLPPAIAGAVAWDSVRLADETWALASSAGDLDREATEQVLASLVNSAHAATLAGLRTLDDAAPVFDLLAERWTQLEAFTRDHCDCKPYLDVEAVRSHLLTLIYEAAAEIRDLAVDGQPGLPRLAPILALRHALHRLPRSVWDRSTPAADLARRLQVPTELRSSADLPAVLEELLDSIEIGSLMLISLTLALEMAGVDIDVLALGEDPELNISEEDEGAIAITTLACLAALDPPASSDFVATALMRARPELHYEGLADLLDGVRELRERDILASIGLSSRVFGFLTTVVAEPTKEWLDTVARLLRDECLGAAQPAHRRRRATEVLLHAVDLWGTSSGAVANELLLLTDEAVSALERSGESALALQGARADLLFVLAQSDSRHILELRDASELVLAHADDSVDGSAVFSVDTVMSCCRYVARQEVMRSLEEGVGCALPSARSALERLQSVAGDPSISDAQRSRCQDLIAELVAGAGIAGVELVQELGVVSAAGLMQLSPMTFISPYLGDPNLAVEDEDRSLLAQAVDNLVSNVQHISAPSASYVSPLEVLTRPEIARRLDLSAGQVRSVAGAAMSSLRGDDPHAAALALRIALNVDQLGRGLLSDDETEPLLERAAETFVLAASQLDPPDADTIAFLRSRAGAVVNFGAVTKREYEHRFQVAIAAHLLAVRAGEADEVALTAYQVGDLARHRGAFDLALLWFEYYDRSVAGGALSDPAYASLRRGIEWDRAQLDRVLTGALPEVRPDSVGSLPERDRDLSSAARRHPALESESEGSYMVYIGQLVDLQGRCARDGSVTLDSDDESMLLAASRWRGRARATLHLWSTLLHTLADPAIDDAVASSPFEEIADQVLNNRRRFPEAFCRVHLLPVLELIVLVAIRRRRVEVASQALLQLAERTNQLLLSVDLAAEFLAQRPTTVTLRNAANLAYEDGEVGPAVGCAEVARLKLLSVVLGGGPIPLAEEATDSTVGTLSDAVALDLERVAETCWLPSQDSMGQLVADLRVKGSFASVVSAMCTPWVRLLSTRELPSDRRIPWDDEMWSVALAEPTLHSIQAGLDPSTQLIYPFFPPSGYGFLVVGSDHIRNWLVPVEQIRDAGLEPWTRDGARHAGRMLAAMVMSVAAPEMAETADMRFVTWHPTISTRVQDLVFGFWLQALTERGELSEPDRHVPALVPSSRLTRRRTSARVIEHVAVLGDPTVDLAGPWLEAAGWKRAFGASATLWMGSEATSDALIASLLEADLVVISGHTSIDLHTSDVGLRMHDKDVSWADLGRLRGRLRARDVVLACCSAGASGEAVSDEMLGLGTVLLAVGVRHVLAPLEPIADAAAGIGGVMLADAVRELSSLPAAYDRVGRDLLRHASRATDLDRRWLSELRSDLPSAYPHSDSAMDAALRSSVASVFRAWSRLGLFGG